MKKIIVTCQDKYEAQKLASLIFIKEGKETFIVEILDVINLLEPDMVEDTRKVGTFNTSS